MPDASLFTHTPGSEGGCFPGTASRPSEPDGVGCVLGRDPPDPLYDFIHPGRIGLIWSLPGGYRANLAGFPSAV